MRESIIKSYPVPFQFELALILGVLLAGVSTFAVLLS